jgi:hypothetical protein
MTRSHWVALAFCLSLALNVFLAVALWRDRHAPAEATPPAQAPACSEKERQLRETLQAQLCSSPLDCAAIEVTFARLDEVRGLERQAALDRWASQGKSAGCQAGFMSPDLQRLLCPWDQSAAQ